MTASTQATWLVEPFVVGTDAQFAAARGALERIGFTQAGICAGAGIDSIYELPALSEREVGFRDRDTPLSLLVQLFMDGEDVSWDEVRAILAPADLAALREIGLLQSLPGDPTSCVSVVALYPTEGLYVASDRHGRIQLVASGKPVDLVYSALTPETQRFVELMPRIPCDEYLELCSGTGIAALVAARDFAGSVWAVDITRRSTRFADFNAALNGLHNVCALEGDVYEPVAGRTFDVITAHPPYVPSTEMEMVFRDGGEDGEQVTRTIIEGLAAHLRPGGRFYCDCMMTDRAEAPLEQRIRHMLGPAHAEFDVLVGQVGLIEPEALLSGALSSGRISVEECAAQRVRFERLGIERFVNTGFLIRRRQAPGAVVTRRRVISSGTRATHLAWYLELSSTVSEWEPGSHRYLDARPRASRHAELLSRAALRHGRWAVTASTLATQVPFSVQAECPVWFGTFLTWCDGESTARDLLLRLRNAGIVPDAAADADFATLIGELAEGGFIELDILPFPADPPA
ncbi:MAG: class I SAM-dependent methyltransferase [Gemmatimonadota bacterium]|nr:class I SAM-dependent methyltransferase [Gemmatimonadota bacterium]